MVFVEQLGIEAFDKKVGGLPPTVFNVIETPDHRTGLIMLGHYLYEGLQNGEECALVTFENALTFVDYFNNSKMNFAPYLNSGQFKLLNFKPAVSLEIGLTQNYEDVFKEIIQLAGNNTRRIAVNQLDALFSLHNHTLINSCAQKISASVAKLSQTILGQYVQFNDQVHYNLSIACRKVAASHLSLKTAEDLGEEFYRLHTNKIPWNKYDPHPIELRLESELGFVSRISTAA